jgi:hypothetical protein
MNEDEKAQGECLMHKILLFLLLCIYLSLINKRKVRLLDSTLKQKRALNHFKKHNPFLLSLDG